MTGSESAPAGVRVARLKVMDAWLGQPRTLRALRLAAATWFVIVLLLTPTKAEFLLDPGRIGNDVSNYLAAGERLNAGHQLYRLGEGDRPVTTYPPFYTVPLVSPPPIAVVWRLLDLLPESAAVRGWWLGGLVLTTLASLWVIRRGWWPALALVVLLTPDVAWTAWSGNVNAYVVPALVASWAWQLRQPLAAGVLAGAAAGARLTPAVLGWWGLVAGRWRWVTGMVVALVSVAAVSLAGAGLSNHLTWLEVARYTTTTGARDDSLIGLVRNLGLDPAFAGAIGPAVMVFAGIAILLLRGRPAIAWVVATLAMVLGSPVTHQGSLALLLAIAAASIPPFAPRGEGDAVPSASRSVAT
jgi:hypothetical protein